jgi:restriction endonuclease S subunit
VNTGASKLSLTADELPNRGWTERPLLEVAEFTNGKPYESYISHDGKFHLITLDSVDINGNLKPFHKRVTINDNSLRAGDLVTVLSDIAHGYLLGLTAPIPPRGTYVLNQRMGRLRIRADDDPRFLRFQINASQNHFRNSGQGTSQRHIYKRDFANLTIGLPAPEEQRRIANALSDVYDLIAVLERLIAKKQAIRQAMLQQLLTGRTRLSGIEGSWPQLTLGDAVEFLDSQRRPVKVGDRAKMRGDIPYYGASGVVDHVNRYLFDEDLILLGEDGENILSRAVPLAFKISGKSWVNNHAHVLRPRPGFNIDFLTAYLESLDYSSLNTGTAQPKLNKQSCLAIQVHRPPVPEQHAIGSALSDVDAEISTLQTRIDKVRDIKTGMMQQLLTGRTRLPVVEGAA